MVTFDGGVVIGKQERRVTKHHFLLQKNNCCSCEAVPTGKTASFIIAVHNYGLPVVGELCLNAILNTLDLQIASY